MTCTGRNRFAWLGGSMAILGAALGMAGPAHAQSSDCRLLDGKVWVDCPSEIPDVSFFRYDNDRQWARIDGDFVDGAAAVVQIDDFGGERFGGSRYQYSRATSTRPDVGGQVRYAGDSAYVPMSGEISIVNGTFFADFDFSQDSMTAWRSEHDDGRIFEINGVFPIIDHDGGTAVPAGRRIHYPIDGEWAARGGPTKGYTVSVDLFFTQHGQAVGGTFHEGVRGGAQGAFMGGMVDQDAGGS